MDKEIEAYQRLVRAELERAEALKLVSEAQKQLTNASLIATRCLQDFTNIWEARMKELSNG